MPYNFVYKLQELKQLRDQAISEGKNDHAIAESWSRESLVDYVYNTLAIENSPITLDDVRGYGEMHLTYSYLAHKYSTKDTDELESMYRSSELLHRHLASKLSSKLLSDLHIEIYKSSQDSFRGIFAGEYRTYPSFTYNDTPLGTVKVDYLHHGLIEDAITDMIFFYNASNKSLADICKLKLEFITIHPFGDGNGRVSRHLLNWALMSNYYIPVTIPVVRKAEYIDTLRHFHTTRDESKFLEFIADLLIQGYRALLNQ